MIREDTGDTLQKTFQPFVPAQASVRELTLLPLLMGVVLGLIFGVSSLYLVLKVGLTVSASIPVAVISISLFRFLSLFGRKDATILENNIVQTAASAGESMAFGIGVTMPAIMLLGFDLELGNLLLVAAIGGLLGILLMVPLRRTLIVLNHGRLKYPEGTACAEILQSAATARSNRASINPKAILMGFGVSFLYETLMNVLKLWKEVPQKFFGAPFKAASISLENNPALLGVGYIIGPRIASIMCAGGVLSYLILVPLIKFLGEGMLTILPPATRPISAMSPDDIRAAYVLYIGAGAVAAGAIINLGRSLPTIWRGL